MIDKALWQHHIAPLHPIPTALQPTGQLKTRIEAVVYDIYGTLFISASGDIGQAQKKAVHLDQQISQLLYKYDLVQTPEALKRDLFSAIEQQHGELKACGIEHPEVQIDRVWQQVLNWDDMERIREFALEYELIANPVYPMPDLKRVLAKCKGEHLPMGIISNAQFFTPWLFVHFLSADTEELGFSSSLTIYSYETGHAKPSPHLFQLASKRLQTIHLNPANTLFVGNDMLNDIYPARCAGFQTALFAGDQRSLRLRSDDPRCNDIQPDVIITDLVQLLDHLF